MKKNGFVILSVVLAAALIVAAFVAYRNYQGNTQENISAEEEEIVTFDWYINYSWFKDEWGESAVSKKITEDTGVSIHFETPVGTESNTLDTMISSNTLPDLITLGYWEPQLNEMIEQEKVFALNELANQFAPEFYEVADVDSVKWYTLSDGNIYAYPNSSYTMKDYEEHENIPSNQVFIVRKDIYEAIGSPDMTTPEGFMNAVRMAAEQFPEVDGEELIPIGSNFFDEFGCTSFDDMLFNYLAIPNENEDGTLHDKNTDEEYLSWLKVFRQMNQEGYIKGDIFVDERTQITEKIRQGRYFCMFYQWTDLADQENEIYQNHPERVYIAVDGPRNSNGDDPVLPTNSVHGWTVTLISKNCKDPGKAIQFLSYLMSEEGQKAVYLGVEGVTYEYVDGKPVVYEEVQKLLESDRTTYNRIYGADDTYWMLQDNVMQLEYQQAVAPPLQEMKEYTYPYTNYTGQYTISIPENTSLGRKYVATRRLWGETLRKLLIADSEETFDQIIENYKAERDALGYAEVLGEEERQVQENKIRLGIIEE